MCAFLSRLQKTRPKVICLQIQGTRVSLMVKLTRNFWGKCLLSILSSWAPFVSVSVLFRFADLDSPYNELQYVAPSCSPCYRCICKIQKGMCCSALRCVAVCCSVLRRCVAACRSPCFRCFRKFGQGCVAVWCTALQRVPQASQQPSRGQLQADIFV